MPRVRNFGVYKVDVNQGNYLTKDQVERLRVGQTRAQVRTILGSPLVTSAFHANRWDYVYELKLQGATTDHRKFAVFFAEDKLTRWEGDEMPTSAAILNRTAAESGTTGTDDRSGFFDWVRGVFGRR